jgi:O-antigen/teichoic acid export membrane protein
MIKKIVNSSLFLLLGNIISRATIFIVNIVAARILPQEIFGQFMFLRSTISMADGVISASFGNITVKKTSEYQTENFKLKQYLISLFFVNISLILVLMLGVFIFSDELIYYFFLNNTTLKEPLFISLFILFTSILASLAEKVNIGLSNYKEMAVLSLVNIVLGLPLVIFLVHSYKLNGLLWGIGLYFLINLILKSLIFTLKNNIFTPMQGSVNLKKYVIGLFKSSSLLVVWATISALTFWTFRLIIINKSENFSAIASFDVAYQWVTMIMLITGATTSVALQMFAANKGEQVKIFRINLLINLTISIVFSLIFSFFASEIMSIYGDNYEKYYYLIYVVSLLTVFATIDSIYNKLFIANNNLNIIIIHTIVSACISISFALFYESNEMSLILALTFLLYYFCFFVLDTLYILFKHKEYFVNKRNS